MNGPLSFVLGIVGGMVGGLLMAVLLPRGVKYNAGWRAGWLFAMAVLIMKGFDVIDFKGASSLAVLIQCGLAVRAWGPDVSKTVSSTFTEVWNHLAQPLLFGLVGTQVQVNQMKEKELLTALAILAVSLTWRLCVTFIAVSGAGLRKKERLFVAVGWLPKATVQASIGGWALKTFPDDERAHLIFTASVLAILLTAPAGAALITAIGPILLNKEEDGTIDAVGAPLLVPEIASLRSTLVSASELGSYRNSRQSSFVP